MRAVLFLVSFLTLQTLAMDTSKVNLHPKLPFVPALAVEQKEISFNSLYQEMNQFQQLNNWHSLIGRLEVAKLEQAKLRIEFARAQKLRDGNLISEAAYEKAQFLLRSNELRVEELEANSEVTKQSLELARLGVIQEGDEEVDLRRVVAQTMRTLLAKQVAAQEVTIRSEELRREFLRVRLETIRPLAKKDIVAKRELKEKQAEFLTSGLNLNTFRRQREVLQRSVEGIDQSIDRLVKEGSL